MNNPKVCAVCLTADRHRQTERAIKSFLAQTYTNSTMLLLDTGEHPFPMGLIAGSGAWRVKVIRGVPQKDANIGALRNIANGYTDGSDVLIHWDSDDWSHPRRIEDQLGYLGANELVGYSSMLFWDVEHQTSWLYRSAKPQQYCIGTSFCYWRESWRAMPFKEMPYGEDDTFAHWRKRFARDSIRIIDGEPRPMIIAEIHEGNTSKSYNFQTRIDSMKEGTEWARSPAWDYNVREIMSR
jgi:glycosyltransferase involved in cell wall biosynthesis